jgi:hypothetical protein
MFIGGISDEANQHGGTRRVGGGIAGRYSHADRTERGRILDEFTAISGFASTRWACFEVVNRPCVLAPGPGVGSTTMLHGKR